MRWLRLGLVLVACTLAAPLPLPAPGGGLPKTGPETEKRFPPLRVPAGFKATLFACDPLIEYPSAIALGPRPGSLFVAVDYLTGLGTGLERHDEVRLLEDTDGDGYADRATVFAGGLNSVQGLAYHDGTLYVMHAPYLTALRDTKGTGRADERRDLLAGLGLPPEKDQIRLHNANAVVPGHDGWLYLALGDHGCDVRRPEGDRLVLHGGGVLRCRPDGRDLHVFAHGLRNIYDVALDEELNVLTRDNENDGGTYKIRVCHSFFGADHGYPYLYEEHPDEALPPLADLGLGASAGGACYLETQFPAEYRGGLLFCEWGRAVVRYPLARAGASFATPKEADFAAGDPKDPYGFRPADLVVDQGGSLFIADWADGQRPRRGRGRVYQVRYVGKNGEKARAPWKERGLPAGPGELVTWLDSDSYAERCRAQAALGRRGKGGAAAVAEALAKGRLGVRGRLHAVWVLAKTGGPAADRLLALAEGDPEPRVRAQALRALADLSDPVLVKHRLDAGAGDAGLARRVAALAAGADARVQLEAVIVLGRLRWAGAPAWLRKNLTRPDAALAHAAMGALRRADNWPAVLKLLDEPGAGPFRGTARRAVAGQYDPGLVDGLIGRLEKEADPGRRREYAGLLARVYKKPAAPWTYWGFRPPPRPANTVAWERSEAIARALDAALADPDRAVRRDVLRRMLRERVPAGPASLGRWLREERDAETVAALLAALRDRPGGDARPHLEAVITDRKQATANRLQAVALFLRAADAGGQDRLAAVAGAVEDGPVLAALLGGVGARQVRAAAPLLVQKLGSKDAGVRAAALGALAEVGGPGAGDAVRQLLGDGEPRVRAAAARAAGTLGLRAAADLLLKLARDADADVRRSGLEALRRLREPRALPVALAALGDPETAVMALEAVGDLGGPEDAAAVADLVKRRPSAEVLAAAGRVLTGWAAREGLPAAKRLQVERALAEAQGGSGVPLAWHVNGPLPSDVAALATALIAGQAPHTGQLPGTGWRLVPSAGTDARVRLGTGKVTGAWLAYCELTAAGAADVEFFTTATAPQTVWLNGRVVYRRDRPGVPGPYPERFQAALAKGANRLLVRLSGVKGMGEFQLRFRRKSATAAHERLTRAALSRAGNPAHGRQVFLDADKSLCLRCHRVGDRGERVGPDLTGLGSRFSKAYIVESVLDPGRTVAPSFEQTLVEMKSGKLLSGIKVAETEMSITLVDSETKKHVLARADIQEQRKQAGSAMPDGLEKRLTEDEFVDLMSYLVSLKEVRGR
jgi:putative membrane-bound dehydrogenase-like protein